MEGQANEKPAGSKVPPIVDFDSIHLPSLRHFAFQI
jgi:hypothetical protein